MYNAPCGKNYLCELNGQETDEGTFADDLYVGHVVLSENNREILLATDAYGRPHLLSALSLFIYLFIYLSVLFVRSFTGASCNSIVKCYRSESNQKFWLGLLT